MKPIATFKVRPSLPDALKPLLPIAYNLRWSWDHAAIDLFRRFDRDLWEAAGRNPVRLLGDLEQPVLEAAAKDDSFLAHLNGVSQRLDAYLSFKGSWYQREHATEDNLLVAYFSLEFGVTECLPIFAGGLGMLAGDHLKASSDLGLPLVGVGLLYQEGYFRQYLNAAGWQQEAFEDNDFHVLPIELVPNVQVHIQLPDGAVTANVWRAVIGRIQLYLLDANVPSNRPEHRAITAQLYGGDLDMRLRQEILLGVGGVRALDALGLHPSVYHMNEGHSAFLALERVRSLMEAQHLSFAEACVLASSSLVFTTHTPVPAGHDYFPAGLMDYYFGPTYRRLGVSRADFLALGRQDPANESEDFCMTVLALRMAAFSNGVSKLHGSVSRRMWNNIWRGLPENEVPIGHVTNGVHFRSWVSFEMNQLYDRYLGPKWREEPADTKLWQRTQSIPAGELWRTHERRRERLVGFARRRLQAQLKSRGASQAAIDEAEEVLSPDALTIGFARRFATYKRATLLLRDRERLARLLNDPHHPVQIIYAGKAHPRDQYGKELIKTIVDLAARPEFRRRLVFLEDYDVAIARYMVQGCDIWLNTPLRPQEASGTSGMKAQANGVLNVSTLDGWWEEAWQMGLDSGTEVGWAIGKGESYQDPGYQDQVEAEALYQLLEKEIVPAFYDRRADNLPRKWIDRMKASIIGLCPEFNMQRMVMQYTNGYYVAVHRRHTALQADNAARARNLAAWRARVEAAWPRLQIKSVSNEADEFNLGNEIAISAVVFLNSLTPDDVLVQILSGRVDAHGEIKSPEITPMQFRAEEGKGCFRFQGSLHTAKSGFFGFALRILPRHPDAVTPFIPNLITWANDAAVAKLEPAVK
ncbi:MAG TPA: alpha-glucan family phosphorylase [Candidatus Eremiobacteraceae bacterium]|nr:alpha-glucan family phosphorylase [Candidatus Eremiobacteraceae bacterium]